MADFCPQCGASRESGDKFCNACGAKLDEPENITSAPERVCEGKGANNERKR